MAVNVSEDPEYWLKRAEEARAICDEMKDAHTNAIMLDFAKSYEKIARWVEERNSG